ncbi:hypothetical protein QK289_12445 [Exiguobacterium antarcticum]|uniref:Lipoprotein n=1 Tax=Exiguobacterium antarcticum TaxID=132920 RepID=A0ABT6R4D9_9BACL|nr:hypothetical protein [Exiguobacterium antarcticum]MDI3235820.1 hypothetical protein [Exiguobacterium antarcticum]
MKQFVIILFCVLLAGCTEVPPSGVQSELELGQYTQAVDQSTRQDTMHDPAKLMVQLETALASYHFKEVVKIARTIDQLALAQDNPIRLRANSLQLSAEAMLVQLKQVEGTYQIERSTLDTGLKERSFPATGQIDVFFAKRDGLVATIDYQDFGMVEAPRNDTESIRFEPDLSARLALSEGLVSYVFNRSGFTLTFEGPGGKLVYQLKKI